MTKWLHSGRRRDLCALLYDAGELRAQSLKSRLESHYDERIDPRSFYATLTSLARNRDSSTGGPRGSPTCTRLPTLASAPSSTTTRGSRIGSMVGHPDDLPVDGDDGDDGDAGDDDDDSDGGRPNPKD